MSEIEYYKILEVKNGKPRFLFHGINRVREIPLDVWLECEKKEVKDSLTAKSYISAFHAIAGYETAVRTFDTLFKNKKNRFIVRCYLDGNIRLKNEKPRVVGSNILADKIYFKSEDVKFAIKEMESKK